VKFGSSTIVVAIEAIKQESGRYKAFVDNGRQETDMDVMEWAKRAESLGAGEIVITSVDREGTGTGYDIDLVRQLSAALSVPVIAHGGGGKPEHIAEVIEMGKANAVAIASCLHYDFISEGLTPDSPGRKEGNVSFLASGRKSFHNIQSFGIGELKDYLISHQISCRPGTMARP
jgi:cyclase